MSKLHWSNITVKLGDLKPWAANPKFSTKAQAKRIKDSWEQFGQVMTIAVDPELNVLDGHQRLSVLLTLHGADYQVDARQSSRPLTDEERRAMVLALTNATGSWNWEQLSSWSVDELKAGWMDADTLKAWNNDANNLKELLKSEQPTKDAEPQVDRAAELLEKWQVKLGDCFAVGEHRIICGDCTDLEIISRLMEGDHAQAQISDPPFMVRNDEWDTFENDEVFITFTADWLNIGRTYCDVVVAFMADKTTPQLREAAARIRLPYRRALIWQKPAGSQFAGASLDGFWYDFELIQVFGAPTFKPSKDTRMAVLSHRTVTNQEHGAEKPVALLIDLVAGYSEQNGIVLDMFGGTGSVLMACANTNRRCRIVEQQEKFVAVQLERMSVAFPELEIKRL